jgi:hypothetical protein
MGDSRRFDLFAKLAEKHIDKRCHVVDVACGKGYLQAAMRQLGFSHITSWDKRKRTSKNRRGYRYGYFDYRCKEQYDAVVAMHPDEGTDHAILYAGLRRVPALVCPCCVKPDAVPFWGTHKFSHWVAHLKILAEKHNLFVQEYLLRMNGKNLVLILKPNRRR